MIRRLAAAGLLLAIALTACGRTTGTTSAPSVATVYGGRVGLNDLKAVVDPTAWVEGPPTFGVRPLNNANLPEEQRFELRVRFSRLGTAEAIHLAYQVWQSTTYSTALMTVEQQSLGKSLTGPKAGDQVLYYNQNTQQGAAPYLAEALVRVGQTVIVVGWARVASFIDTNSLGKVAAAAADRLKSSLSGRLHPSPASKVDRLLLPPSGPDISQLGITVLPVDVVAQILFSPAPELVTSFLRSVGADTVVFGDYALNEDTRMEIVTAGMTFTGSTDVARWITTFFPSSGMQGGVYINYEQDTGQYVAAFGAGNRAILAVCKSSQAGEEAGRSCEGGYLRTVNGWRQALASG